MLAICQQFVNKSEQNIVIGTNYIVLTY